jgi:hypothetical protein
MTLNQLAQKIEFLEKNLKEIKLLLLKKKFIQKSISLEGFFGKKEITEKDIGAAKKSLFRGEAPTILFNL